MITIKTTLTAIAIGAALGTGSAAHAEWACPYFNFAYYPAVRSCPNWQWDANGPQAQAQAKTEAAAQAREQARAERAEREQARAAQAAAEEQARVAQAAAEQQAAAENSPNNWCRDPAIAGQLIKDFNSLTTWQQAVDIEHLTTNVGGTAARSCHGVFVLTNGRRLEGNLNYRPNVAGDLIVAWVDGGAASLPPLPAAPTPIVAPADDCPVGTVWRQGAYHCASPSPAPAAEQPKALPVSAPQEGDAMLRKGLSDRLAWETWFNGLQGDEKTGAFYWAGQRSLPHPGSCQQMSAAFYTGCTEAKERLTASDALRKSEQSYRLGWNSYIPQ